MYLFTTTVYHIQCTINITVQAYLKRSIHTRQKRQLITDVHVHVQCLRQHITV